MNHYIAKKILTQKGFTIIEVMIGITIFAVGYLAMSSLQISSTNQFSVSSRVTVATSWTTDQVEKIIGQDYDNIAAGAGNIDSPDGLYTVSWTVVEDVPLTNTKTITITTTRKGALISNSIASISFIYIKGKTI